MPNCEFRSKSAIKADASTKRPPRLLETGSLHCAHATDTYAHVSLALVAHLHIIYKTYKCISSVSVLFACAPGSRSECIVINRVSLDVRSGRCIVVHECWCVIKSACVIISACFDCDQKCTSSRFDVYKCTFINWVDFECYKGMFNFMLSMWENAFSMTFDGNFFGSNFVFLKNDDFETYIIFGGRIFDCVRFSYYYWGNLGDFVIFSVRYDYFN